MSVETSHDFGFRGAGITATQISENSVTNYFEIPEERNYTVDIQRKFFKGLRNNAEALRSDRDILMRIVSEHRDGWLLLKSASPEIRKDKELLLAALQSRRGWWALRHAPAHLQDDREVAAEAVRKHVAALEIVSPRLHNDPALRSEALSTFARLKQTKSEKADLLLSGAGGADGGQQQLPRREIEGEENLVCRGSRRFGTLNIRASMAEQMFEDEGRCEAGISSRLPRLGMTRQCIELKITDHRGRLLVKMGHWNGEVLESCCLLPGHAVLPGNHPREILAQYLDTTLHSHERWLEIEDEFEVVIDEERRADATTAPQERHRMIFSGKVKAGHLLAEDWRRVPVQRHKVRAPPALNIDTGRRYPLAPAQPCMYCLRPARLRAPRSSVVAQADPLDVFAWLPTYTYQWLSSGEQSVKTMISDWLACLDFAGRLR